jgi:hypothetical protein
MGSYFQSSQQVQRSLEYLSNLTKKVNDNDLSKAVAMLQTAVDAKAGLYVTF